MPFGSSWGAGDWLIFAASLAAAAVGLYFIINADRIRARREARAAAGKERSIGGDPNPTGWVMLVVGLAGIARALLV